MTLETYLRVAESFPSVRNVYLSGWGEPLLNPHFREMLEIAKEAGCSVGFTTNGAKLDVDIMETLVNLQIDLVSLSIAGSTVGSHESKRVGSDFHEITEKLTLFDSIKDKIGSDNPRVILLFMIFKDNLDELPGAVELAARVGAGGIVATNLDYVGRPIQDELKAFSCEDTPAIQSAMVREAMETAEELGVYFNAFPLKMEQVKICSEDPLNNIYISERGEVSPCVYLNPPLSLIPRIFCGEKTAIPALSYGNINENSLLDIWESEGYTTFRMSYEDRLKRQETSPIPDVCRTCYKAYGV
jgi:MoaA/NifB/PqqE/SkfB family radical SAM enzyme